MMMAYAPAFFSSSLRDSRYLPAMDDSEKKNHEVERLCLIDVSSEDDCLITSSSGDSLRKLQSSGLSGNRNEHGYIGLFEPGNAQEGENAEDFLGQSEQVPLLYESFEPERTRKNGKCNLRKSLAWDSAFFTSAGVLDSEELSTLNKGFKKVETHHLPGIQEDMRRSAESNSTLDSDSLTVESLGVDFFEDIRASIQKSSTVSDMACSSSKIKLEKTGVQSINSSKKPDLASRSKPASISGESNSSSLKPPKILGRVNPIAAASTKRASLGANRVKMENNTVKADSVAGRGVVVSKKPGLGDSCNLTPSRSSSSSSSDTTGKSPLNSSRRKIDSRHANPASFGSTLKTPQRILSRNKTESGNSRLSTNTMSMSKLSSSISPASSIDGWSSESSSSTSTVNQRSDNSKEHIDTTSPCRRVSLNSVASQAPDLQSHQHGQPCVGHESQGMRLLSQYAKKSSMGTGALSQPASTGVSRSCKPTGLRMPSPKIGFFDAASLTPVSKFSWCQEKSMVRTPKEGLQFKSGVCSVLPKIGTGTNNLNGGANKTKPGKLQPAKMVTGTVNIKLDSQQTGVFDSASGTRLTFLTKLQEIPNASPKVSGPSRTTKNSPGVSSKFQNDLSSKTGREDCSITKGIGAEGPETDKHGLGSGLNGEGNGGQGVLKNKMGTKTKGQVHVNINPFEEAAGEAIYCQQSLENNLHSLQKSNEKEILYNVEDQVHGLSRLVGDINLSVGMMKELSRKKEPFLSQLDVNNPDESVAPELSSSCSKELLVHGQNEDLVKSLIKPSPVLPSPTNLEIIPNTRTPLAVNDSLCNRSVSFELSTESKKELVAEKAFGFPFPECAQKENS
ncbi:hypothetical protein HHK36_010853 [Tetracentron sinense]|uniref:Uncharacterized protein n=1 Tax=Tetracentron sinense TaxID=13715 RepID=A0A835DGQ2_TETSI|nr:hypothetical protein HHK36_010853 [Tetracentron sinense]